SKMMLEFGNGMARMICASVARPVAGGSFAGAAALAGAPLAGAGAPFAGAWPLAGACADASTKHSPATPAATTNAVSMRRTLIGAPQWRSPDILLTSGRTPQLKKSSGLTQRVDEQRAPG